MKLLNSPNQPLQKFLVLAHSNKGHFIAGTINHADYGMSLMMHTADEWFSALDSHTVKIRCVPTQSPLAERLLITYDVTNALIPPPYKPVKDVDLRWCFNRDGYSRIIDRYDRLTNSDEQNGYRDHGKFIFTMQGDNGKCVHQGTGDSATFLQTTYEHGIKTLKDAGSSMRLFQCVLKGSLLYQNDVEQGLYADEMNFLYHSIEQEKQDTDAAREQCMRTYKAQADKRSKY